jgi:hypothetical protein
MEAIVAENNRQGADGADLGEPAEQFDIVGTVEARIVSADLQKGVAADQGGQAHHIDDITGTADLLELSFALGSHAGDPQFSALLVDQLSRPAPADDIRLALSRHDLPFEPVGRCQIVGVQAGDPGIAGGRDAGVRVEADAAELVA